jgi:DNA-binding PadR family transcriptional regulator
MAASDTRLLVLGATCLFEPVNGYKLRRELLSWNVEDWAHIKPGSIYSMLTTLTRQGHLQRHDVLERRRTVAVYTVTDRGRAEFRSMVADALTTVDLSAPLTFHLAVAMVPLVPRAEFVRHLDERRTRLSALRDEYAAGRAGADAPPHAGMIPLLWSRLADAELTWVRQLLDRVEAGEFDFLGETPRWTPAEDDPGRQLARDRERYRQIIGLS